VKVYDIIQENTLAVDNVLNSLIYESSFCVITYTSYKFSKMVCFFIAHPVALIGKICVNFCLSIIIKFSIVKTVLITAMLTFHKCCRGRVVNIAVLVLLPIVSAILFEYWRKYRYWQ